MTFENENNGAKTVLPFYADGYPGIMFQMTGSGLYVQPQNKKMPALFLYGQTIHPINLEITGAYRMIVFQLYPFVINSFFSLQPRDLNDDCFDLTRFKGFETDKLVTQMLNDPGFENWNSRLTSFLFSIFQAKKKEIDGTIQQAIQQIIENEGQQSIAQLRQELHLTERTFERRFIAAVGVSPKQFSKMIQFQRSLQDITGNDYVTLTDVVYKNGFTDQSHFIRVFKAFTGKTPGRFAAEAG